MRILWIEDVEWNGIRKTSNDEARTSGQCGLLWLLGIPFLIVSWLLMSWRVVPFVAAGVWAALDYVKRGDRYSAVDRGVGRGPGCRQRARVRAAHLKIRAQVNQTTNLGGAIVSDAFQAD